MKEEAVKVRCGKYNGKSVRVRRTLFRFECDL